MRRRTLELMLMLALSCAHPTRASRVAAPGEPTLKVLTYNVNYAIGGDPQTVQAIVERDADLVFLQETNEEWRHALEPRLQARYPGRFWLDDAAAGGMAVLSKRPLTAERLDNPNGWFPAVRLVTNTPLGRVQALCVHQHPPVSEEGSWVKGYLGSTEVRRAELGRFLAALEPELPTLVAGDFNEGTSGDAVQLLEEKGLRTALPEFHPEAKTWHWPVGSLQLTAQFDHVAYSAGLEPIDAHVERVGSSDHFPVTVDFVRVLPGTPRPAPPSGGSLSVSGG
jgi:endonuclease/exonuclease/phosphatase (EEP) superfamily protein YafD